MEEDWRITLSCIESPDPSFIGYQKVFTTSPITIGRAETNMMIIPDPTASRNHAIIRITNDYTRVFITDISTPGTEVSGKVVPKGRGSGFTLEVGDTIKIGQTVLQYELNLKTSLQSTMIGEVDRSFLDKPHSEVKAHENKEEGFTAPEKEELVKEPSKKFSPVSIGIIIISLIAILYLIFSGK